MRQLIALAFATAVPAAALAVVSCSSSSDSASDAGAHDAKAGDVSLSDTGTGSSDAGVNANPDAACGPGPWVDIALNVYAYAIGNPSGANLAGAQFSSPLCPGFSRVTDQNGNLDGLIAANTPFYGRVTASGELSELMPEQVFDAASPSGNRFEMLPTLLKAFVPGIDLDASPVVVSVSNTDPDAGACSAVDGIQLTVPGHPEAKIIYFSGGSGVPMEVPDATATTSGGLAVIEGLNGSAQYITLQGQKAGCNVSFTQNHLTGRTPLENGYVSLMPAYVTP